MNVAVTTSMTAIPNDNPVFGPRRWLGSDATCLRPPRCYWSPFFSSRSIIFFSCLIYYSFGFVDFPLGIVIFFFPFFSCLPTIPKTGTIDYIVYNRQPFVYALYHCENRWPCCVRCGALSVMDVVPFRLFTINELFLVIWSPLFLFRIRLLLLVAGCRLLAVTTCHVYFIVTLFFSGVI